MIAVAGWLARTLGLAAGLSSALAPGADAACRKALALGLDVSGSVDSIEYRLQLDGLAAALLRPEVQEAILAFPDAPVRLFVFEWAGAGSQRRIIDWTPVTGAEVLEWIAGILRSRPRIELEPSTAIGQALLYGGTALAQQPECWQRTLDLSGDGKSNSGLRPRDLRDSALLAPITVNGLVVGAEDVPYSDRRQAEVADIWAYYRNEVIRGPDAFVEVAVGFSDFEDAMARKLLREMQALAIGELAPLR